MGNSPLTRRATLSGAYAALMAGTAQLAVSCHPTEAPIEAPAAVHDPALVLINRWNELSRQAATVSEHEFEQFYDTHLTPIEKQVQDSVPAATTAEGAIAALRKVLWFDDLEDQDANLVRSALAYLEGRA